MSVEWPNPEMASLAVEALTMPLPYMISWLFGAESLGKQQLLRGCLQILLIWLKTALPRDSVSSLSFPEVSSTKGIRMLSQEKRSASELCHSDSSCLSPRAQAPSLKSILA